MMVEALEEARVTKTAGARRQPLAARAQRLVGTRLLVVEDNMLNQQIAKELFAGEGVLVETAANGRLGIDAIQNAPQPFHAFLMDIQMSVMDDLEATRLIRESLKLPMLPIIAVTANALTIDQGTCLAAGMNAHLGKPYKLTALIKILRELTGFQSDQQTGTEPAALGLRNPEATYPGETTDDFNGALDDLGREHEFFIGVLETYLGEPNKSADDLDRYFLSGDLIGATRVLHTMKGLSTSVGAHRMSHVAKTAEHALKAGGRDIEEHARRANFRAATVVTNDVVLGVIGGLKRELAGG